MLIWLTGGFTVAVTALATGALMIIAARYE
jgi:hypothetical protein